MHVEMNYRDIPKTDALDDHIRGTVDQHLGRFGDRVTRVEVHVGDHNASKSGPNDKRCLMEARPTGQQPVIAEAEGEDLYAVITDAATKLRRILDRKLAPAHH